MEEGAAVQTGKTEEEEVLREMPYERYNDCCRSSGNDLVEPAIEPQQSLFLSLLSLKCFVPDEDEEEEEEEEAEER